MTVALSVLGLVRQGRKSVTGSETVCSCYDSGPVSLGTGKMKDMMRRRSVTGSETDYVMTVVLSVQE